MNHWALLKAAPLLLVGLLTACGGLGQPDALPTAGPLGTPASVDSTGNPAGATTDSLDSAITITAPLGGELVASPLTVTGSTQRIPADSQLGYRLTDQAGQSFADGVFPVVGAPGSAGVFTTTLTFTPPANGTATLTIFDRLDTTQPAASIALQVDGSGAAVGTVPASGSAPAGVQVEQAIGIDTPAPAAQSPVQISGCALNAPTDGVLEYRVYDASTALVGEGAVPMRAGSPNCYDAAVAFTPPIGGVITIEIYDRDAGSGLITASSGIVVRLIAR